jgi:glycosyltransferase involved in cell wall biosynthesis
MITVIMRTNGMHPHLIGEAIASVLKQTYWQFKLLILNSHPDKLVLADYGLADQRIDIVQMDSKMSFPERTAWAIAMVDTKYWCIVDSDDIILENHLQTLIHAINNAESLCSQPIATGCKLALYYDKDRITDILWAGGWWKFAFRAVAQDKILWEAKHHTENWGFDSVVLGMPCWNKHILPVSVLPTYIYRYNISYHVSKRKQRKEYNFKKLEPIKIKLLNDYEKMAADFFRSSKWLKITSS